MSNPEVTGSSPVGGIFAIFEPFLMAASHGRCFSSSGAARRRQEAPGGDDGGVRVLLEACVRGGGGGAVGRLRPATRNARRPAIIDI
jgi:hypothetical protein